ncbi:MAG: DinB family protein [Tepidiformaceae bacterium]
MATIEQVSELKEKMAEERGALIVAARSLSPEEALRVPEDAEGEEQWTALEQLAHLWEMERAYDAWVRAALARDNPDLRGITGVPVAIPIQDANAHAIDEMLRALEVERAYTLGVIDGMALEAFERMATSPMFGTLTVLQWLRSFYRHDRQHAAQIAGRQSDYKPSFKMEEPNQRRMRLEAVARGEAPRGLGI